MRQPLTKEQINARYPITEKQKNVYRFLIKYLRENDEPAGLREISKEFGFSSHTSARKHVAGLLRHGKVKKLRSGRFYPIV